MTATEAQYIPHAQADAYRADGWTIIDLGDTHHGRYAVLATRAIPMPAPSAAHEPGAHAPVPVNSPDRLTPTPGSASLCAPGGFSLTVE